MNQIKYCNDYKVFRMNMSSTTFMKLVDKYENIIGTLK